jgi:hypothetical protein
MTLKEIAQMVSSVGYPCVYSHFSKTPEPPYLVYYYPSENDVMADNSNYTNRRQLFVELFTRSKDFAAESAVEAVLKANGFTWYKQTDFLNDEKLFQTTFEMEVLING